MQIYTKYLCCENCWRKTVGFLTSLNSFHNLASSLSSSSVAVSSSYVSFHIFYTEQKSIFLFTFFHFFSQALLYPIHYHSGSHRFFIYFLFSCSSYFLFYFFSVFLCCFTLYFQNTSSILLSSFLKCFAVSS